MPVLYDRIGRGYRPLRVPDARIERALHAALGAAASVVNVGAGAGSYEPTDRRVVAVEPALTMIRQRPAGAAPVVRANAEALPFADDAFDAALAILTVHHWRDPERGLLELRRVARGRVVLVTWDPDAGGFWLTEYFPAILDVDRRIFPSLELLAELLGAARVSELPVPHDCTDGFLGAYWRRPSAYLDEAVRAAISAFACMAEPELRAGLARLERDLADGEWERRYGDVREHEALDLGYRLVVAT